MKKMNSPVASWTFDVRRSSFILTCDRLQNNLALMGGQGGGDILQRFINGC